jgi:SAM-dependent methyltransferase
MTHAATRTDHPGQDLRTWLQEFYGKTLKTSADLSEKACCTLDTQSRFRDVLELIPEAVKARHYGCGCPLPPDDLNGLTVLDLGSGAGVDAFLASYLVGPSGFVHGVDMTDEQLAVSREYAPVVAKRFGYPRPNTAFHKGFIETADDVPDASVDLVISDCVINLSPAKEEVFRTLWRVLKPGGEFSISDIFADRRVPESIRHDPRMIAECLGGAEYEHDGFDQMKAAGFLDPRVVSRRVVQTEAMGTPIVFSSLTVRAQKFEEPLDRRCEDYGQIAVYKGTLPTSPARFAYDDHHVFETGRPTPVCRNTARMLSETRLAPYFDVTRPVHHFGLFVCGPTPSGASSPASAGACCP